MSGQPFWVPEDFIIVYEVQIINERLKEQRIREKVL